MSFIFRNTEYDLSKLKAGIVIDSKNEFLKKYDKNNNSIFDSDEFEKFNQDLNPYINDGKLDNEESINLYAKVMKMTVNAVRNLFAQENKNLLMDDIDNIFMQQYARDEAIKNNNKQADDALEIYHNAKGGSISKFCNSIKELFNTEYAGDKIYRQLAYNKAGAMILEISNENNLTQSEYAKIKFELLEFLLNTDKLSADEAQKVKNGILNSTLDEIDDIIIQLKNAEDNEYEDLKNSFLDKFKNMGENKELRTGKDSLKYMLNNPTFMNFNDVFKKETGVEFNPENILKYQEQEKEFQNIARKNNEIANIYNNLDNGIKEKDANKLNQYIEEALNFLCNDEVSKRDFLELFEVSNIDNLSDEELKNLAKKLQNQLKNTLEKFLNGKSIEEHMAELKEAKEKAFGTNNNVDLAQRFEESQQKGVGYVKMGAAGVGLIATLAGGPMALVGIGISVAGGAGISFTEEATKKGDIPPEKIKEILDELKTSALLTAAGGGSGAISNILGKLVLNKGGSVLLSTISEYGSDAIMSLLSDLAITGEIDLTGEGIAQIINIATGLVAHKKIAKTDGGSSSSKELTLNTVETTVKGKTWDDVKPIVEKMCKKYGMDYKIVIENYLKGLSTELIIFKDEEKLAEYIESIYKLSNKKGYKTYVFNFKKDIKEVILDDDLIRNISLLKTTSTKNKAEIEHLCKLFERGEISKFELKRNLLYLEKGYISSSTFSICYADKNNFKITDLYDDIKPDESLLQKRKDYIDTIKRLYPNLKTEIDALIKELGDDIYKINWEVLTYKNIDEEDFSKFIKDIKNIKYLKECEVETYNYFINIDGYKKNEDWAKNMVAISDMASVMLRSGESFDNVMAFISKNCRDLMLGISPNPKKDSEISGYGIIRGHKEGYLCMDNLASHGAITPFDCKPYIHYAEKFRKRYGSNGLKNPYAGRIELTKLVPDGHYPLTKEQYNPNDPTHFKEIQEDGTIKYYSIREAMIHPEGKYGVEGLKIAEELHNKLLAKFKGKDLTGSDMNEIHETIGEIHWVIAHTMPWGRGSDAIANSYIKSLYESLGIKTYPPKEGISFDLEAFCTELDDYKKMYKNLYSKEPEYIK